MTIVGKILVFIVLLFSLVVFGLAVVVYMARVNHASEYKKEQDFHKVDVSYLKAIKVEYDALVKLKQDEEARHKTERDRLSKQLEDGQTTLKELTLRVTEAEKRADKADAVSKLAEAEVAKRQQDVEKLRVLYKEELDKVTKLVKETNELRERTTSAEIGQTTALNRNKDLEKQLQEMARDIARIRANQGAAATTLARDAKNPPPQQVEGKILQTDPTGLYKISLGSDAGLARNHTMEVYRVDRQNPLRSKYLGTIRIIDVNHKEAVAQPLEGKMLGPIQVGDDVASRILGG